MNIFVLAENPSLSAVMMCDKHVVKMVLETAQLLCSQFEPGKAPYRRTHYNHPCSKWARERKANFEWLVYHGISLSKEYNFRYGKTHKSLEAILWAEANMNQLNLYDTGLMSHFAQAMPDKYKHRNAVTAYRNYYLGEKSRFAKWEKGRKAPEWWITS